MNLDQFREEYSGASFEIEDFAHLIVEKLDPSNDTSIDMYNAAKNLSVAIDNFYHYMKRSNIELG